MTKIRIMLADDHRVVRDGLRSLLEQQEDFEIVGEAENGREAVRRAMDTKPDIVMMDIRMADLNGIEATRQLVRQVPTARVIALSMCFDQQSVSAMIRAGASGFLVKDCGFRDVLDAVRTVATGDCYFSPRVAHAVIENIRGGHRAARGLVYAALTAREREVLQMIAEGVTSKEIAKRLGVTVKAIDKHRGQIGRKLKTHNVAEWTKLAIREGLTDLDAQPGG